MAQICIYMRLNPKPHTYQARRALMLEEEMAQLRDAHAAELDNWRRWQVIKI
jgi:hypothetical protein